MVTSSLTPPPDHQKKLGKLSIAAIRKVFSTSDGNDTSTIICSHLTSLLATGNETSGSRLREFGSVYRAATITVTFLLLSYSYFQFI